MIIGGIIARNMVLKYVLGTLDFSINSKTKLIINMANSIAGTIIDMIKATYSSYSHSAMNITISKSIISLNTKYLLNAVPIQNPLRNISVSNSIRYNMRIIFLFISWFSFGSLIAQDPPSTYEKFKIQYRKNIRKTRIAGVYIPKNLDDVFAQLKKRSEPDAINSFKSAPEDVIAKKLHFGLGRWMIVNWNFEEGSRISHYLQELGLRDNDDKAEFLIVSFHRHLNEIDLEVESRVKILTEKRKKEKEKRQTRELLETKPIPKEKS